MKRLVYFEMTPKLQRGLALKSAILGFVLAFGGGCMLWTADVGLVLGASLGQAWPLVATLIR